MTHNMSTLLSSRIRKWKTLIRSANYGVYGMAQKAKEDVVVQMILRRLCEDMLYKL